MHRAPSTHPVFAPGISHTRTGRPRGRGTVDSCYRHAIHSNVLKCVNTFKLFLFSVVFKRVEGGIRRSLPRGCHQEILFPEWNCMILYMVGKLVLKLTHFTKALVKSVRGSFFLRDVSPYTTRDKFRTSPTFHPFVERPSPLSPPAAA